MYFESKENCERESVVGQKEAGSGTGEKQTVQGSKRELRCGDWGLWVKTNKCFAFNLKKMLPFVANLLYKEPAPLSRLNNACRFPRLYRVVMRIKCGDIDEGNLPIIKFSINPYYYRSSHFVDTITFGVNKFHSG